MLFPIDKKEETKWCDLCGAGDTADDGRRRLFIKWTYPDDAYFIACHDTEDCSQRVFEKRKTQCRRNA